MQNYYQNMQNIYIYINHKYAKLEKNVQKICTKYVEYAQVYVMAKNAYICTLQVADALGPSVRLTARAESESVALPV